MKNMPIAIESGIPIPVKQKAEKPKDRRTKYPFAKLKVGESFSMPITNSKRSQRQINSLRVLATVYGQRSPKRKFTVRKCTAERVVRVWCLRKQA